MPAVLSKHLARLPFEDILSRRRQDPRILSLPVGMLHGLVLQKRMTPPGLSWSSYSAKEGILEPELAQVLLEFVNPLPWEVSNELASKGHKGTSMTYWILEEEVHAFKRVLNNATAELRGICENMSMDKKWLVRARTCLETFENTVAIEVDKGRSLVCWFCQEPVDKGSLCGLCRSARYCSSRCQKKDWKTHRQMCTGYALVAKP